MNKSDIIVAIATAAGRAGVGIIRISGYNLESLILNISHLDKPQPRHAYFSHFYDKEQQIIDSGLLLFFKHPNSFTGEDVVELQAHGGNIVLNLLLRRCIELGARLAEPGEFSKRAFLNEKIDLIQAESIADLIDASSESAAKMATRSLQGTFSKYITNFKIELTNIRALVEGSLDFPEEDIDFLTEANIYNRLIAIKQNISTILKTATQGSILREGITLVLIGAPNVGKSSLLNSLAENDVAIVTDIAGTTRDIIREQINIDGIKVNLIDTAGLRETEDIIEKIGIEKSHQSLHTADIALILIDPSEGINNKTQTILDSLPNKLKRIYLYNKIDLINETPEISYLDNKVSIKISVTQRQGLDLLKQEILRQIGYLGETDSLFLARSRHVIALNQCLTEINSAINQYQFIDLLAEHLKNGQNYLSEITGEFNSDDLLGIIFSQFCIGK